MFSIGSRLLISPKPPVRSGPRIDGVEAVSNRLATSPENTVELDAAPAGETLTGVAVPPGGLTEGIGVAEGGGVEVPGVRPGIVELGTGGATGGMAGWAMPPGVLAAGRLGL